MISTDTVSASGAVMVTLVQPNLWTFISGTPEFCPWFISGFRLFRNSPSRIYGDLVPMTVTSSENGSSDDLVAQ